MVQLAREKIITEKIIAERTGTRARMIIARAEARIQLLRIA